MRFLVVAIALLLAGCSDDPAPSTDDDAMDPGDMDDTMDDADNTSMMPEPEVPRQTVQITITWSGIFMVNGAYDQTSVSVPANSTVELTFVNDEVNPLMSHDLVVEGIEGASTSVLGAGEQETVTFDVGAPQATAFFCSVGNHRDGGMEGDFVVE